MIINTLLPADACFLSIVMRDAIPDIGVHQSTCLINDKLVAQKIKRIPIIYIKKKITHIYRTPPRYIYDASGHIAKYILFYTFKKPTKQIFIVRHFSN